jgi:ADP-dependent NAD(P)H-hydrate dehydratase / NAD(P)H-hydrate epimerase
MKALTAAEMREVDRLTTERLGIPSLQLMENAGRCVADVYRQIVHAESLNVRSVCVLCGKGNNGGDGFVVARDLKPVVKSVRVFLFASPDELRGDSATNFKRWQELGGEVIQVADEKAWELAWPEIAAADALIDSMFGTGFRGVASGAIGRAIRDINCFSRDATSARPALILAVDTPSGLPSDGQAPEGPVIRAHHTVTLTAPKIGQLISDGSDSLGALHVANLGSPAPMVDEIGAGSLCWAGPEEFAGLPLVRRPDGHKGLYGHVLVVAGSLGKSGAAVMAGHAALSSGAGLVTIATPDVVLPIVAAAHPEFMTESLYSTAGGTAAKRNLIDQPPLPTNDNQAELESFLKSTKLPLERIQAGKDVLAIGPGLGQHAETQDVIRSLVRQTYKPIILDADGLNAFVGKADKLGERNSKFVAVTPHPGEMARLLGVSTKDVQADRVKTATDAAQKWNVHVVLKGAHTILASPDGQVFVNTTGNAGLAKGGSGDTLTGILAACTGQFKTDDWLRVLALGVYLHGAAADLAVRGTDPSGLLASEVANAVPKARRELLRELQRRG